MPAAGSTAGAYSAPRPGRDSQRECRRCDVLDFKPYACAAAAWHAEAVAKIKEKAAQRATDLKEIIDGIKRSGMTTRG